MNKRIIIFCMLCALSTVGYSQDFNEPSGNDELIITRSNGNKIKIISAATKSIQDQLDWKDLLEAFQDDFAKVRNTIPNYDFFKVMYVQGESLIINEIEGEAFYIMKEDSVTSIKKNNFCRIQGQNIIIDFQITNLDDLLDKSILEDISLAISKVKYKFLKGAYSVNVKRYDIDSKEFTKTPQSNAKFVITPGINIGFLQGDPTTEIRIGGGIRHKKNILVFTVAMLNKYDKELRRARFASWVGPSYYHSKNIGAEFLLNTSKRDNFLRDYNTRLSFKWKYKSSVFSLDFYSYPTIDEIAFTFGFGF